VPAIGTEFLLLLALLFLNGILAMSELAVVSARKIRLQQRAEAGDVGAAAALALADEPSRFLSTIQIGITAVGILAGAFGGATLSEELNGLFGDIPALAPHRDALSFGLVVIGITYLSLIIGELVPKQIALSNPERIAAAIARPMHLLSRLAAPLVWLLSVSTDGVLRLLRIHPALEEHVTEDEIKLLIQQGTHSGAFEPVEQELMEGALDLGEQRINELMTPRLRVVWLDVEDPPHENWSRIAQSPHTRFPVCEGDLDTVLGIVSVKDLWARVVEGGVPDLRAMPLTSPGYVLAHQPALKLFEVFQTPGVELAFVLDEHGGIQGIVSLGDLMEALVGDAARFGKRRQYQPVQRADGSWLLDGLLAIDDVTECLRIAETPAGSDGRYQSLGGLIFNLMGKIPTVGETVSWDGWRFEIVDMDGNRIDKVLATPFAAPLATPLAPVRKPGVPEQV
jgi:putative hemolysin